MILLSELLSAPDFKTAVDDLARGFREEHELPPAHQLGLAVPDVETAAAELEARGIGPFFIASGAPALWRERGQERSFQGKLGMAYYQGLELELLEPGSGSDFYRECLDPQGRIIVQHLGFLVDNVDQWSLRLVTAGIPVWVRGRIKSGPLTTEFAYMDTMEKTGLVIEFISWKFLGLRFSPPALIYRALGRFEKLIGKRSLSL